MLPEREHKAGELLIGSSHLAISKPALVGPERDISFDQLEIECMADGQVFKYVGIANPHGYVHKIVLESLHAATFDDAQIKAYRYLAPSLSNWAIHLDIPFDIYQVDVTELATGHYRWSILNPYQEAAFKFLPEATMSKEFRSYASLYREALNSSTVVYQFLCFFKIIEGVQARRNRINKEARKIGTEIQRYVEIIPDNKDQYVSWLNSIFHAQRAWDEMSLESIFLPEAIGKKCSAIVEKYLRPLRLRIAHAITDYGELSLSSDDIVDLQKVDRWLPLGRCIARRMLKNEFPREFLTYLDEEGRVKA